MVADPMAEIDIKASTETIEILATASATAIIESETK